MIRKAQAEHLLRDDTFRQVFDIMRQEQVKLFLTSKVEDTEVREEAHRMNKVLDKFERILKNVIVDEERKEKREKLGVQHRANDYRRTSSRGVNGSK